MEVYGPGPWRRAGRANTLIAEGEDMSTTKTRERLKDQAMEAYLEWRVVCSAVDEAYECWNRGPRDQAADAFVRYRATLDAEERSSLAYARLMEGLSA
jgi:hypothetical protein